MCGLVAIISKKKIDLNVLKLMNDEIKHRGPNDEGYLIADSQYNMSDDKVNNVNVNVNNVNVDNSKFKLAFAHRRLSIQDLSELGQQPMSYKDRYWIVFNGEIYNHLEIRSELEELGHKFKSHSDTEVLLAAFDEWGEDCQTKLNGMWAFIILDCSHNTVFISRDRFGIKPLYYYQTDDEIIFASEIKSILKYEGIKIVPNNKYCKEVYESGALEFKKETAFEQIYRFDIASFSELKLQDDALSLTEKKYWDFEINTSNERFCEVKAKKIADEYYQLLKDAVRLRLRADVPFGSALSGGLDSTSIVYLIEEILKESDSKYKQQTFSTIYSGKDIECDESKYIYQITKMLNIKANTVEPSEKDFINEHERVIKSLENPMSGTGLAGISTYKLIDESDVVVTLDGQGADEQQGGYLNYIVNHLYNVHFIDVMKEFISLSDIPKAKRFMLVGLLLRLTKSVVGDKLTKKVTSKFLGEKFLSRLSPLNKKLKNDSVTGLINLIHFSDSRSMLFSIESRMPFMDYKLVEFTAKIPACYKIHKGWTKYFARLAFEDKLPENICWRKDKMGWPVPDKRWFEGELNEFINLQIKSSNFIKTEIKDFKVEDIVKEVGVDKAIRLLNIATWEKTFF